MFSRYAKTRKTKRNVLDDLRFISKKQGLYAKIFLKAYGYGYPDKKTGPLTVVKVTGAILSD